MKFKNNLLIGFLILATFISVIIATYSLSAIFKFPFNDWLKSIPSKISKVEIKNKLPSAYIVQSGSMEPSIKTGSIVISYPQLIYAPGDVITYSKGVNDKNLITHRVEVRNFPEGVDKAPVYKTSGDANEDFDSGEVKHEQVVGKVITTFPYLGYLANVAKKPYGFILIVIVPATIIIYEELKSLLKEISNRSRFLNKFRKKNIKPSAPFQGESFKAGRTIVSYVLILFVPFFGASLVFTALASSYFSDNETSTGNVFQASDQFGPPIAQTLVINEILYNTNCTIPENKQWIELWNGSANTVDLKDWSLRDHLGQTIQIVNSVTLLNPGQFALLSKSSATWNDQCYGPYLTNVVAAQLGGQITIDTIGGSMKLLDLNDLVIDRVDYGTMSATLAGLNRSKERDILGQDSITGDAYIDSDFVHRQPSTSGFATPQIQNIVVNEFVVNDGSAGQGDDWVEIYNKTGASIDITNWTLRDTTGIFHTFSGFINANDYIATPLFNNRLDNGGDKIYLFDNLGSLVDGISYYLFVPTVGNSIGRFSDGANAWNAFISPTIDSSNNVAGSVWP